MLTPQQRSDVEKTKTHLRNALAMSPREIPVQISALANVVAEAVAQIPMPDRATTLEWLMRSIPVYVDIYTKTEGGDGGFPFPR